MSSQGGRKPCQQLAQSDCTQIGDAFGARQHACRRAWSAGRLGRALPAAILDLLLVANNTIASLC